MTYERSVVVFRRDLRVHDNTALVKAAKNSEQVVPVFVFDERQYTERNEYLSLNALQFMLESLEDLHEQFSGLGGELFLLRGEPSSVLRDVCEELGADALFLNEDYTPFSKQRDEQIKSVCADAGLDFVSCFDVLLTRPGSVLTQQGEPYQVFTPFKRRAREQQVARPSSVPDVDFYSGSLPHAWPEALDEALDGRNEELWVHGGRSRALDILDSLGDFQDYNDERNVPSVHGTTYLSAHHKFGTVSVRESYHAVLDALGADHTLISELYWRDFFHHVAHFNPEVFGEAYQSKYRGGVLDWEGTREMFERWCEGRTGFPIVDAGMRQLVRTGWMHNRVRMIVASFLTKDLRCDWRWGERFFAQHLVDYDPCVNNGNWQWAASTGCDAQPYFRIFNPWSQQERYDPGAEYIQEYVEELADVEASVIHSLEDERVDSYPAPMVDHSVQRERTLSMFKSV